jgi:hypothetical protein
MYDSITLTEIPDTAQAVAGYVNGRWPTYPQLASKFPHAQRLSIAVTAEADADALDIENGDATPSQAPAWVRRQAARGVKFPAVYCSVSQAAAVLRALSDAGIRRSQVRLWTAHYTGTPHRCTRACVGGFAATADATQYTDKALGKNLDASLVSDAFFDPGVGAAVRRRALRAWVLAQRAHGTTWAKIKSQSQWRRWRKLGGK